MTMTAKFEEQKEKASKTLGIMLDYLGLEASIKIEEKNERMVITIASDDAGRIIGRKGQTLESLQLLLNRMMFKADDQFPRLSIDIDGYSRNKPSRRGGEGGRRSSRDRKRDPEKDRMLEQQAVDAAKEVKRWGESIKLQKMNAHDRRIIHITLQDDAEIVTSSEGEGPKKSVIISAKK